MEFYEYTKCHVKTKLSSLATIEIMTSISNASQGVALVKRLNKKVVRPINGFTTMLANGIPGGIRTPARRLRRAT